MDIVLQAQVEQLAMRLLAVDLTRNAVEVLQMFQNQCLMMEGYTIVRAHWISGHLWGELV